MVKDYEDNIIEPPLEFRDGYKPIPTSRTKKTIEKYNLFSCLKRWLMHHCTYRIYQSTVSRNGPLLWIKFLFTSPNKSLLLFIALRELFRDSTKMNLKSSQNCRLVKLVALGERSLESCTLRCC